MVGYAASYTTIGHGLVHNEGKAAASAAAGGCELGSNLDRKSVV